MKRFTVAMAVMMLLASPVHAEPSPAKDALKASKSRMIGAKLSAGLVGVALLSGAVGRAGGGGNSNPGSPSGTN